jgi:hypothetical protein
MDFLYSKFISVNEIHLQYYAWNSRRSRACALFLYGICDKLLQSEFKDTRLLACMSLATYVYKRTTSGRVTYHTNNTKRHFAWLVEPRM